MKSVERCMSLLDQLKEVTQRPYNMDSPVGMKMSDIIEKLAAELDEGDRIERERLKKSPFPMSAKKATDPQRRFSNGIYFLYRERYSCY
jgi:hypothetical protein